MAPLQTCENCCRTIGRLEQAHVWGGHVVCAACRTALAAGAKAARGPAAAPPVPQPAARRPAPVVRAAVPPPPTMFACARCGEVVAPADLVEDVPGRRVCRDCLMAAAALESTQAGWERGRDGSGSAFLGKVAVALLVLSPIPLAVMWYLGRDPQTTTTATATTTAVAATAPALTGLDASASPVPDAPGRGVEQGEAPPPALDARAASPPPVPAANQPAPPPSPSPRTDTTEVAAAVPAPTGVPAPEPTGSSLPKPPAPEGGGSRPTAGTAAAPPPPGVLPTSPPRGAVPAAPPPRAEVPAVAAPPVATPPASPLEAAMRRGKQLMAEERYEEALEAFQEAAKIDAKASRVLHAVGLAYYHIGREKEAIAHLEKALAATGGQDRRVVFNLATANLKDENPMRAVKVIRDYLSRPKSPPDEILHQLLGTALTKYEDKSATYYLDCRKFFFAYQQKLESKRKDGKRLWGTEWIPASAAQSRWQEYQKWADAAEELRREVGRAEVMKERAKDSYNDIVHGFALRSNAEKQAAADKLEAAVKKERDLRKRHREAQAALGRTEKPPFPTDVRPLGVE